MNKTTTSFIFKIYIALLLFPCSELALRILGYQPFHQVAFHIEASPKNCIIPDSILGFTLHPGCFEVTINQGLHYNVEHGNDSLRVTNYTEASKIHEDSVYFFGCSYTYGMGVSDSLTFPFLVGKSKLGCYTKNFGVPGYGTLQSYMQLKQLIARKETPSTVIINYADFHDDRNAMTPTYRRDLYIGYQRSHESVMPLMQKAQMPFMRKTGGSYHLKHCAWKDIYQNSTYRETFALFNFVQDFIDQKQTLGIDKEETTLYIFKQIKELCANHGIRMIVAGITSSQRTKALLQELNQSGIETLDISVDLSLNKYTNAPYDDHPNRHSHAIFSERIVRYLTTFD